MSCFPISTIELAETQAAIKKEPTKEALNLNGGNDEACLGFPPRSESFAYEPSVQVSSISSLSEFRYAQYVRKSAELAKAILTTVNSAIKKSHTRWLLLMAGTTRLELATSCVTGMRSNQLSYAPIFGCQQIYNNMLKKNLQYPYLNLLIDCLNQYTTTGSLNIANLSNSLYYVL